MIVSETQINPAIARQIFLEAEQNGVSVEDYLKKVAEQNQSNGSCKTPKVRKNEVYLDFSQEHEWLRENRQKFIGKWVVLDGKRLVGDGDSPKEIVEKARHEGVKIPFVKFITDDSEPFCGGWS
jgi:hypothetical protein